ncbi:MAG TPA: hypothetical protein PKE29_13280, partial [Phycisphaerales bacterium]|nr:hypothetical protein [Phycisphaerales bacterium]
MGAGGGALAKGTVPPMGASGVGARAGAFVAPANWKAEADGSGILAAAFTAENAQGGARITLASLFNDGGGLLANINRWRGQVDL